jgi:hypothetical protein
LNGEVAAGWAVRGGVVVGVVVGVVGGDGGVGVVVRAGAAGLAVRARGRGGGVTVTVGTGTLGVVCGAAGVAGGVGVAGASDGGGVVGGVSAGGVCADATPAKQSTMNAELLRRSKRLLRIDITTPIPHADDRVDPRYSTHHGEGAPCGVAARLSLPRRVPKARSMSGDGRCAGAEEGAV